MNKQISVAIDGPSGAGKSTVARAIAAQFGFIYVDTGAIYRTVGLAAQLAGVNSKDAPGVIALLPGIAVDIRYDADGVQQMLLNGSDVSDRIRTPVSSIYASDVSAIPEVRAFLMEMQRDMARRHSVIMDGRDIGTVVLPDANVKVFLTASPEERARRRYLELLVKGTDTTFEQVLRDINYRDQQDSSRKAAPLKPAADAVYLDTSKLSFDESVAAVAALVKEQLEE